MVIVPTYIFTKSSLLKEEKYDFVEYTRGTIPHALKSLPISSPLENMLTQIYGWEYKSIYNIYNQNELVDGSGALKMASINVTMMKDKDSYPRGSLPSPQKGTTYWIRY